MALWCVANYKLFNQVPVADPWIWVCHHQFSRSLFIIWYFILYMILTRMYSNIYYCEGLSRIFVHLQANPLLNVVAEWRFRQPGLWKASFLVCVQGVYLPVSLWCLRVWSFQWLSSGGIPAPPRSPEKSMREPRSPPLLSHWNNEATPPISLHEKHTHWTRTIFLLKD